MVVKSLPTLPAYPSSTTRKNLPPSQLSTLQQSISNALSAVLVKGLSAAATSIPFLQSYTQDHAFSVLQAIIWDHPQDKSPTEKAIHTKVLQLAQILADSGLLTDCRLLVDLAIVYARSYPSKIHRLFEKVAETSGSSIVQDIKGSLIPSFTQILESGQGLYNQRKAAECIYCFVLASNTSPSLLTPFARNTAFLTALARQYLPGLSATARSYGGANALLAAINSSNAPADPTEWTSIYLTTKVTLLDTLHFIFKRLLTDLATANGPRDLALQSENAFSAIFAMIEASSEGSSNDSGGSSIPPTPFLNYTLLQDYQQAHDLSSMLGRALQKAQERDARLDLLESALGSVSVDAPSGSKKKDPGALKLLIRGSGLQRHHRAGDGAFGATAATSHYDAVPDAPGSSTISTTDVASQENDLELASKASQVLDLLPDASFDYVILLLKSSQYAGSVERVIEALLDGSAPSQDVLARESRARPAPAPAPEPAFERRNVFDDEVVDFSSVRVGKKDLAKETVTSQSDRLLREEMKADILRRVEIMDLSDSEEENEDDIDPFALADAPQATTAKAKGKAKIGTLGTDDEDDLDDDVVYVPGIESDDDESDDDSIEIITTEGGSGGQQDASKRAETMLELAYLSDPSVFARDAVTRRSKARADLQARTGWDHSQIEGWAVILERNPKKKDRLLLKHEFRGNRAMTPPPQAGGSGQQHHQQQGHRGGGGGRGRGGGGGGRGGRGRGGGGGGRGGGTAGGDGGDRAYKDRNKASHGNHNRKRGHDKKMARAGGPS